MWVKLDWGENKTWFETTTYSTKWISLSVYLSSSLSHLHVFLHISWAGKWIVSGQRVSLCQILAHLVELLHSNAQVAHAWAHRARWSEKEKRQWWKGVKHCSNRNIPYKATTSCHKSTVHRYQIKYACVLTNKLNLNDDTCIYTMHHNAVNKYIMTDPMRNNSQ